MAASQYKANRILIGTVFIFALSAVYNMNIAGQKDSFGVVRNPIVMWSAEVAAARETVLVATYKFSSKEALNSLAAAHANGVEVFLIIDGREGTKNKEQVAKAREKGISVYLWPTDSLGEFHGKFTLIDNKVLIMGSFNLSKAAVKDNTESFLITRDSSLVSTAITEFQRLLGQSSRQP